MASILAIEAGTKYLSGHSDLLLGLVSANDAWFKPLHRCVDVYGAFRRARRTSFWRCAACARWSCACAKRSGRRWRWRNGCRRAPRWRACCTPPCPTHPGHALWRARFQRRLGPVQRRPQAGAQGGGRGDARRPRTVRHRLFLGRLREPGHPVRLRVVRAPRRHGRRAVRRCAFPSASRTSKTSKTIWSAASRGSARIAAEPAPPRQSPQAGGWCGAI